jgi:tetratricopeptide (TPR) repeat protein
MTVSRRLNHASALEIRGDYAGALELYRAVVADLEPERRALVLNTMGMLCHALKDLNAAKSYYEESLAISPAQPNTMTNLANALHELGQTPAAEATYQRALDASHDAPVVLYNYAVLVAENDAGRAVDLLRRCLGRMFQNWRDGQETGAPLEMVTAMLGRTAARHGLVDETASYLDEFAGEVPVEWKKVLENEKALMLAHAGRREEAVAVFRQILEEFPGDTHVRFNLGMSLARLGRQTEAATEFQALGEPLRHYGTGLLHELADEVVDAVRAYRLFLEKAAAFRPYPLEVPGYDVTAPGIQHARDFIGRHSA